MSLHIPASGINIPRSQMPQIKSTDIPNFLTYLRSQKVLVTKELAQVSQLHPSQAEFNQEKVHYMMTNKQDLKKPVLVSSDNILMDGHHRWLALLNIDKRETIPIYRIHVPFLGLLQLTKRYPKVSYKSVIQETSLLDEQFEALLNEGVHDQGIFKVVFLAGGSGSGKDFVLKQALEGHGLVEINSDKALEYLMDKHKLDKRMPADQQGQRDIIRGRAKSITELRQRLALQGRNGIIINGTGAEYEQTKKIKDMLEDMGYESQMVFVNTSNEVSKKRNIDRGARGGRTVPEHIRQKKWEEAQSTRDKYAQLFGKEGYHEFDNSLDLTGGDKGSKTTPRDLMATHAAKYQELVGLWKKINKFTKTPPKHEVAQAWITKEQGALSRNTQQAPPPEKKASGTGAAKKPAQPAKPTTQGQAGAPKALKLEPASNAPANGGVAAEAKKLGLEYYGFGRFGKNGKVTHLSIDGKLVRKQPHHVVPSAPGAPQQPAYINHLNTVKEDRHAVDQESVQHSLNEDIRVFPSFLQGIRSRSSASPTHRTGENGSPVRGSNHEFKLSDLREGFRTNGHAVALTQEEKEHQEEKEEVLKESDIDSDPPIDMGAGPGERIDNLNQGRATTGPIKKVTTNILRKRKQ